MSSLDFDSILFVLLIFKEGVQKVKNLEQNLKKVSNLK